MTERTIILSLGPEDKYDLVNRLNVISIHTQNFSRTSYLPSTTLCTHVLRISIYAFRNYAALGYLGYIC